MKKLILCLLLIFLGTISSAGHAGNLNTTKDILDNGMTVLITEMPQTPLVSVYALVKTGAATEGKYLGSGISHFLEHMLFKGTHDRNVGEIAQKIQSVGGTINASTGKDYTIYRINVPAEEFQIALDTLADMLMNSTINAEEVEKEREVIFSEMQLHEDNPDSILSDLTFQNVYLQHPYRHPVIGYKDIFARVTQQDLMDYYKERYAPNNMILSVAGHIEGRAALAKIKNKFKDFKRQRAFVRNLPEEPYQLSKRFFERTYPSPLTRLSIAFPSVGLADPDLYALDVISEILGKGKSSRLYQDLYQKKGLVHAVSTHSYTPVDKGMFQIECLLDYEKLDATKESILKHLNLIKRKGVSKKELLKAKKNVRVEYVMGRQTTARIAYAQALDEAATGNFSFSERYVEGIAGVTRQKIMEVAKKYFDEQMMTTVIVRPEMETETENSPEEILPDQAIEKFVLKNGMTVLIKEDHRLPLICVHVMANGGLRQEPVELNGISLLTASLWVKGAGGKSSKAINKLIESKGIQLSPFSGRNSFGLSLQFLKEDQSTAFSLLEDLIKRPGFYKQELEKTKEHMKTAIRQRKDDIFLSTFKVLKETLYKTHPYRLEEEGTEASIDRIKRRDVVAFYEKLMSPENMVISVIGDIDAVDMKKMLTKRYSSLRQRESEMLFYSEQPLKETRFDQLFMDKQQAVVMIGFHGTTLQGEDRYPLQVLTSILGSSFSGRLFNRIREDFGQAYSVGGQFIPGIDSGIIFLYVMTKEESVDQVLELLKEEIQKLQKDLVSDEELNSIKAYLKGTFKAGIETISSLAFTTGLDELYGLGYEHYLFFDEKIDATNKEDIQKMANKYLDLNKAAIVVTIPESDEEEDQ